MKIYRLHADGENNSVFLQEKSGGEEWISALALKQHWRPFQKPYPFVSMKLHPSDTGLRNYRFDVSTMTGSFIVFSQIFADTMAEILQPRGQFLPVETPSKRKSYVGYYPTNVLSDCLDLERSDYKQYERGKVVRKYVLIGERITEDWLFVIEEGSAVFVTEKFRERVEEKGFQGFSWKWEVEVT